jgi:alkylated DNA repair dioxygenase AlkB
MEIKTKTSFLSKTKFNNIDLLENCIKYIEDKLEERPKIIVYGRECRQNRSVGFFSNDVDRYNYSNSYMLAQEFDSYLKKLLDIVNELTNNNFNGILINFYCDGGQSIGAHSDNEHELGNNGVVSISYGTNRKFRIREKSTNKIFKDIELENRDMVHMGGNFQKEFLHEIPVQKKIKESRYSFTFRRHL